MKGKQKENRGITLIALVITIVIIIILSAIAINLTFGENGLITKAQQAAEMTAIAQVQEQLEMAKGSAAIDGAGEIDPDHYFDILEEEGIIDDKDTDVVDNGDGSYDVTAKVNPGDNTTERTVTVELGEGKASSISDTDSCVGYYADVDGNGSVDGVIYADLAIGGSGQWYNSNGTYTIPKGSNFREYTESGTHTASGFGTKGVIKATSTSGNERFYVMALSNVDSSTHYWYNSAYGNMSDYASATSGDFGTGEKNTQTMITKWNSSAYGSQKSNDMWGLNAVQSGTWNGSTGWYVPSRREWAAFASQLGITKSNYSNYGLSNSYWSSSQFDTYFAWCAYFSSGFMDFNGVTNDYCVRLGTTF